MGYSKGRRHTLDSLRLIAKQYNSRSAFQYGDPGAYVTARNRNILDDVCSHMQRPNTSIPQVNDRKIIRPLELDIYYPRSSFAIEYHGRGWHSNPDVIKRDALKQELCKMKGIFLLVIIENNRNYERDIKFQVASRIGEINARLALNLTERNVYDVKINYKELFSSVDPEEIDKLISSCSSVKEFKKKYSYEYRMLKNMRCMNRLEKIKTRRRKSDSELLAISRRFLRYGDFVREQHGSREEIINMASLYTSRGKFKIDHPGAYEAARRMDILSTVIPKEEKENGQAQVQRG